MKRPRTSWFVSATLHGALLAYAFGVGFSGAPARVPPKVEIQALHRSPPPAPPAVPPPPVQIERESRENELLIEPVLPVEAFEPPAPQVAREPVIQPARQPNLMRIVAERPVAEPPPEPAPAPAAVPAAAPPSDRVRAEPLADNTPPPYPRIARRRGQQGVVVLAVRVDAHGAAAEVAVKTSSGHELLDRAAVDAVRTWRFTAAREAGAATADEIDVTVEFRLQS